MESAHTSWSVLAWRPATHIATCPRPTMSKPSPASLPICFRLYPGTNGPVGVAMRTQGRCSMNNKIQSQHLSLFACIYLRQSTPRQLLHHQESTQRQYAL